MNVFKSNSTLNVLRALSAMLAAFCQKCFAIVVENAFSVPEKLFDENRFFEKIFNFKSFKDFWGKVFSLLLKVFARVFENGFYVSGETFWEKTIACILFLFSNKFGYFRTWVYLIFWRWAKTLSHSVWKFSVVGQICNLLVRRRLLCEKCF